MRRSLVNLMLRVRLARKSVSIHPTQSTKLSYGWIRKGQDKVIEPTDSRTRLNIIGALPLQNIGATVTEAYDTINSEHRSHLLEAQKGALPDGAKSLPSSDGAASHQSELVEEGSKSAQYPASLLTALQSKFKSNRAALESDELERAE